GVPDQMFRLIGCLGGTPTPTATSSPTPTATFTPITTPTPTPTVTPPATVCTLQTGFEFSDVIGTILAGGWVIDNNSTAPQGNNWFQGNTAVFTAQAGAGYVGANFQATQGTTGTETISDWLLLPPVVVENGAQFSFWTRTVDTPAFPDRLQVRFSTN